MSRPSLIKRLNGQEFDDDVFGQHASDFFVCIRRRALPKLYRLEWLRLATTPQHAPPG